MNLTILIADISACWDLWSPVTWCVGLWLVVLGGCVGSFLNVVIYRIPAGKSVVHPGSHCPQCGHAIRWYDNVPVLSWCWLRARCRDCHAAISMRYPLVESAVAGIFLSLAIVEVFHGGANLPSPVGVPVPVRILWVTYVGHVLLMTTLLAVAVINFDGHVAGWKFVLAPLLLAVIAPVLWPPLHPVPVWPGLGDATATSDRLLGLAGSAAGTTAGLVAGLLTFPLLAASAEFARRSAVGRSIVPATTLVGAFLGWPAVMGIAAITSVAFLLVLLAARCLPAARRIPWTCVLGAATFVWIIGWRWLFESLTYVQWLKPEVAVYLGVVVICASALARMWLPAVESDRAAGSAGEG
jgi:leader peptidase (prepilin peptidase)/N-methyltransferase